MLIRPLECLMGEIRYVRGWVKGWVRGCERMRCGEGGSIDCDRVDW